MTVRGQARLFAFDGRAPSTGMQRGNVGCNKYHNISGLIIAPVAID
jgi:hypothetical protein